MKRIILYPCGESDTLFIKHLVKTYLDTNFVVISPEQWEKPDAGIYPNLIYSTDYNKFMKDVNDIYILDKKEIQYMKKQIIELVNKASSHNKLVTFLSPVEEIGIESLHVKYIENFPFNFDSNRDKLYVPQATIIGLGKQIEDLDTSQHLFNLIEQFSKKGLNVVVISENNNCKLLNNYFKFPKNFLHEFPLFNSIKLLNSFIEELDNKYAPDIIFIDIPNSLIKFSNDIVDDYGVSSYIISQSITFDYFLFLGTLDVNFNELIKKLSHVFEVRLNIKVDQYLLINKFLDIVDYSETKNIKYRNNDEKINAEPSHQTVKVIDEDFKYDLIVDECLKQLTAYLHIV